MANTAQAKKRVRQSEKSRQHNASLRSMYRTLIKKVVNAIAAGDKATAEADFKVMVPTLDKMVNKNVLHKNKAARHKSRLSKHIKEMQA